MSRPPALSMALATVFGLGQLRPAPGTWGSLPPIAAAALLWMFGASAWTWWFVMLALIGAFGLSCVVAGDWAEAHFGKKDPGQVVADETAGMALTLLFVSPQTPGSLLRCAGSLLGAFLLFRLMDIIKPPPARGLQRLPSGWGILVDDLAAGVYAGVGHLALIWWLSPHPA